MSSGVSCGCRHVGTFPRLQLPPSAVRRNDTYVAYLSQLFGSHRIVSVEPTGILQLAMPTRLATGPDRPTIVASPWHRDYLTSGHRRVRHLWQLSAKSNPAVQLFCWRPTVMAKRAYLAIDMGASSGRHVSARSTAGGSAWTRSIASTTAPCRRPGISIGTCWLSGAGRPRPAGRGGPCRQRDRQRRRRYLGGRFRPAGTRRRVARQSRPLSRPPDRRHARAGFPVVPREQIFAHTGLQFMQFNTLYQLWAMRLANSPLLDMAESMLMMPDLFHWLLTGEKVERIDQRHDDAVLRSRVKATGPPSCWRPSTCPTHILGQIVAARHRAGAATAQAGRRDRAVRRSSRAARHARHGQRRGGRAGRSRAGRAAQLVLYQLRHLVADGGRGAAAGGQRQVPELNFTNEGGVGGTTRLLKNIAGLWLVQECRRAWNDAGSNYSWDDLNRLAAAASAAGVVRRSRRSVVHGAGRHARGDPDFCPPHAARPVPADDGVDAFAAALESLALRYRLVFGWLEASDRRPDRDDPRRRRRDPEPATVPGHGRRLRRPVLAGPVEATAIGNVLVQAIAGWRALARSRRRERSFAKAFRSSIMNRKIRTSGTRPSKSSRRWCSHETPRRNCHGRGARAISPSPSCTASARSPGSWP